MSLSMNDVIALSQTGFHDRLMPVSLPPETTRSPRMTCTIYAPRLAMKYTAYAAANTALTHAYATLPSREYSHPAAKATAINGSDLQSNLRSCSISSPSRNTSRRKPRTPVGSGSRFAVSTGSAIPCFDMPYLFSNTEPYPIPYQRAADDSAQYSCHPFEYADSPVTLSGDKPLPSFPQPPYFVDVKSNRPNKGWTYEEHHNPYIRSCHNMRYIAIGRDCGDGFRARFSCCPKISNIHFVSKHGSASPSASRNRAVGVYRSNGICKRSCYYSI